MMKSAPAASIRRTAGKSPLLAIWVVALASMQRCGGGMSGASGFSIWVDCGKDLWFNISEMV